MEEAGVAGKVIGLVHTGQVISTSGNVSTLHLYEFQVETVHENWLEEKERERRWVMLIFLKQISKCSFCLFFYYYFLNF